MCRKNFMSNTKRDNRNALKKRGRPAKKKHKERAELRRKAWRKKMENDEV